MILAFGRMLCRLVLYVGIMFPVGVFLLAPFIILIILSIPFPLKWLIDNPNIEKVMLYVFAPFNFMDSINRRFGTST